MVKISDCSCECRDKEKEKLIEERALSSVNKIISTEGTPYYPDGTGAITMPVTDASTILNAQKVPAIESEINQMKISAAETDEAVTVLEGTADNHAREIAALKSDSGDQSKEIAALGDRVETVENRSTANATDITAIKATDQKQSSDIIALQALTNSITKSLITDVEVSVGTDAGSFIVSVVEEDGTKRSSDNFQYGRVGTFELLQGTQAGYVRGRLTLVDGTIITSNDFQILQITATDVYVTSITLTPNYQTGEIGGEIGYSNGSTAQINAIKVPTAPGVTANIEDLLTRMSAAETKNTTQDSRIDALDQKVADIENTPGVGKFSDTSLGTILGSTTAGKVHAEADGTGSVNGWSDKANVSALNATNAEVAKKANQSDLTALQNGVMNCFEAVDYTPASNVLTLTALDGQSNGVALDKNWGTANAGKVLGIGNNGLALPTDSPSKIKEFTDYTSAASFLQSNAPRDIFAIITLASGLDIPASLTYDSNYKYITGYNGLWFSISKIPNEWGFTFLKIATISSFDSYTITMLTVKQSTMDFDNIDQPNIISKIKFLI